MNKILKYTIIAFAFIAAVIVTFAVISSNKELDEVLRNDKVLKGYTFNQIPSGIERNGYIFGVNRKSREDYPLTIINVPEIGKPVTLPEDSNAVVTKAGAVLKWLGNKKSKDTAGAAGLDVSVKLALHFKDAVKSKVLLMNAQKSIDSAITEIRTKLNVMNVDDYDFFMICETIKAKSMDYQLSKNVSTNENFKTNLKKIADLDPKIQVKNDGKTKIGYTDTAYRVVLYKTFPLKVNHSLTGEYEVKVLPAP